MAFLQSFVVSMLLVLAFPAGAGFGCPAPGIGGDVSHQQITESPETSDDEEEEDEEPDCD